MEKVVQHWKKLLREVVQSLSLKAFKRQVNVYLGHALVVALAVLS